MPQPSSSYHWVAVSQVWRFLIGQIQAWRVFDRRGLIGSSWAGWAGLAFPWLADFQGWWWQKVCHCQRLSPPANESYS